MKGNEDGCTDSEGVLRVGGNQQRGSPVEDAAERLTERLGIERRQVLVEHHEVSPLRKRWRDIEAAPFAVGELPARLAEHLR
jgi:hypothetical protein